MLIKPAHQVHSLHKQFSLKNPSFYLVTLLTFSGFFLSVSQILGESPDYSNYEIFFELIRRDGLSVVYGYRFEPGFTIVAYPLVSFLNSNLMVYGILVSCFLFLKGLVIYLFSSRATVFIATATFYIIRFFPLHELTQLRVGCAVGFLFVGATLLWRGNRLYGLLTCAVSLFFHMSTAIAIPILFFQPIKRRRTIALSLVVAVFVFMGTSITSNYLANYFSVFATYQIVGFGDKTPNPFNVAVLLDWTMITIALIMWNSLSLLMKRIVFAELVGMAIFYGALDYPVIAHRFRELYCVFWVFFVADGLRLKTIIRIPTIVFCMASILLYSYVFIFSGEFFF